MRKSAAAVLDPAVFPEEKKPAPAPAPVAVPAPVPQRKSAPQPKAPQTKP